jgi:cation:H+ antiporter
MSTPAAILVFLGSLAVTLAAAAFFADRLDHLGPRLGLQESVVGLLTALAADAPELASAVAAVARGQKEVGLGVIVGSNAFNLAAMLGISALAAGAVVVERRPLAVEGAVGVGAAAIAVVLVAGLVSAWVALGVFVVGGAVYALRLGRGPARQRHPGAVWPSVALLVPAVALIAVGATGMVRAALTLADRWNVSAAVVGLLVLAVLTSIPNAFTAVRLGLARRGGALVSETLNSNTVNVAGGILVPALVVGLAASSTRVNVGAVWVLGMTIVAVAILARPGGMRRGGGMLLIALYAGFLATQLHA